jgi:hypothetical protein
MEDEERRIRPGSQNAVINPHLFPGGQLLWFALGEPCLHREIGAGQIQCAFEVRELSHILR